MFVCALQEAFAVVREGSKRVLGLRPFDVQLISKSFAGISWFMELDSVILWKIKFTCSS